MALRDITCLYTLARNSAHVPYIQSILLVSISFSPFVTKVSYAGRLAWTHLLMCCQMFSHLQSPPRRRKGRSEFSSILHRASLIDPDARSDSPDNQQKSHREARVDRSNTDSVGKPARTHRSTHRLHKYGRNYASRKPKNGTLWLSICNLQIDENLPLCYENYHVSHRPCRYLEPVEIDGVMCRVKCANNHGLTQKQLNEMFYGRQITLERARYMSAVTRINRICYPNATCHCMFQWLLQATRSRLG